MAAFQVQEAARRLIRLARSIKSPRARAHVRAIATEFLEHERRLQVMVDEEKADDKVDEDGDETEEGDAASSDSVRAHEDPELNQS